MDFFYARILDLLFHHDPIREEKRKIKPRCRGSPISLTVACPFCACTQAVLRVHRLKRGTSAEKGSDTLEQESSQVLDTGGAEVWRCEWNVTGTVLASSGDGGVVQLWKSDYHKNWSCVSEVHGDVSGRGATAPVAANQ